MKHFASHALVSALCALTATACSGLRSDVTVEGDPPISSENAPEASTPPEDPGPSEDQAGLAAEAEAAARAQEADASRRAAVDQAPKRRAGDLVSVAFLPLQGSTEQVLAGDTMLHEAYRDAFLGHEVVRAVDDVRVADAWQDSLRNGATTVTIPADVVVEATAETTPEGAFLLRARVGSTYDATTADVEVEASDAAMAFPVFLVELEAALLGEVGPTLPVNADHLRRYEHLEAADRRAVDRGGR